ncbi:hypothetical protein ACCQ13_00980 [Xanthomonas sp. NCPPB 1638]|uniref:hypothetical protein n=1 Tax=Xanthomonas sp. NCPPB 1638 TaxID=487535 RepID=UPI003558E752
MLQRLLTATVLALLAQCCNASPPAAPAQLAPPAKPTANTPAATAMPPVNRPPLPLEACARTADGFAAFFETIVSDAAVRAAYSAATVEERDLRDPSKRVDRPAEPFRLTLIDYRWTYDEPGKEPGEMAHVKLDLRRDGERMRADFVKAEFSADDEVIRTFGAPEAYVFAYTHRCWQLTQHLR